MGFTGLFLGASLHLSFGAHLKKMRTAKGISGAEFARLLFIDQPNVTRLGRVNPSVYLIKKICDALEVSMGEFFKGI